MIRNWEVIGRLLLASILGGVIGLDREATNRPAGFRTHILVSIGSALIMMVSINNSLYGGDASRIAAQVVSGIGFLGAGTILRTGTNVEGLTTAASLWVCAGIGLATGNGNYSGAVITTLLVLFFLRYSKILERTILRNRFKNLVVIAWTRAGLIGDIGTLLGRYNIIIKDISIKSIEEDDQQKERIHLNIRMPHKKNLDKIIDELSLIEGILEIIIDDNLINIRK